MSHLVACPVASCPKYGERWLPSTSRYCIACGTMLRAVLSCCVDEYDINHGFCGKCGRPKQTPASFQPVEESQP